MSFLTHIQDLSVFVVEPSTAQAQFIESHLKKIGVLITSKAALIFGQIAHDFRTLI